MPDRSQRPSRRWLFVGAGNMASSLVGGLLAAGRAPTELLLIDPHADTRQRAAQRFATATAADLDEALDGDWFESGAPYGIVLAVKPAVVAQVCHQLAARSMAGDAPIVSIAAGVRIGAIEAALGTSAPIVRCMPNTPALLGRGASALFANAACDAGMRADALALFAAVGEAVEVDEERLIDAVTALSGSGPAYVFRFVEHLIHGAVALGLDERLATTLAIRTVDGAAAMMLDAQESPARLRERVTSPGGTTEAALERFDADGFGALVQAAMQAAHSRATDLGDELSSDPIDPMDRQANP